MQQLIATRQAIERTNHCGFRGEKAVLRMNPPCDLFGPGCQYWSVDGTGQIDCDHVLIRSNIGSEFGFRGIC